MNLRFVSTMVAACCALAFVACKGDVTSDGGAGGTSTSTGGTGGTYVDCADEECGDVEDTCPGAPECEDVIPSCSDCACNYLSSDVEPGCADTCDNIISGAASPNFCNGASALPMCEACIAARCGAASADCN